MTMLIFLLATFMALNPAPVDIYRCVGADGVIQFSDEPCDGANSQVLKGIEETASEGDVRLWKWLDDVKSDEAAAQPTPRAQPRRQAKTESGRPIPTRKLSPTPQVLSADDLPTRPESQLAARVCSVKFYECAQADGLLMDNCVSQIQQCSSRQSGACCPQEYVLRYQSLRAVGNTTRSAVRGALLGVPDE